MRQPDIEIYLKDSDQDAVAEWLSQAIAPCSPWQSRGKTQQCQAGEIPVLWLHKAVGNWHCLLLESDRTPWEDDLACARAANAALGVPIRCAPVPGTRRKPRKKVIVGYRSLPKASARFSGGPETLTQPKRLSAHCC